jgi:acetyl esterase/lipase
MLHRSLALLTALAAISFSNAQERISDVIYAKHGGVALTLDVFKPAKPNGAGVIFVVSGGWFSNHDMISPDVAKPLNDQGITVFEVVHGSQPKFLVPEIVKDIQRSVRFVRTNAATYGIDPNKIGIFGGSAGGHLSLMVAGTGDSGNPTAKDPVDRASSEVEAVGAFFPPTDMTNFGKEGQNAFDILALRIFNPAFGVTAQTPREQLLKLEETLSPIKYVTPKFPPAFLIHGDSDKLVPYQQSQLLAGALKLAGVENTLVIVPGAGHDAKLLVSPEANKLALWFKKALHAEP